MKRDFRVYTISHFTYRHVCGEKKNQAVRLPNVSSFSLCILVIPSTTHLSLSLSLSLCVYIYLFGVHCASASEKAAQSSVPSLPHCCPARIISLFYLRDGENGNFCTRLENRRRAEDLPEM